MKNITILFIAVSMVFALGCRHRPIAPQTHTYKELVPPESMEGKQCCLTCRQITLQCQQLANDKYFAAKPTYKGETGWKKFAKLEKDITTSECDREYWQCVEGCGGTVEIKTKTY